jgi:hypothetical protein
MRGGSAAWGLGMGLITHNHKNELVTKCHEGPQALTYCLDKQPKENGHLVCGM